jgi:hypothetical protein
MPEALSFANEKKLVNVFSELDKFTPYHDQLEKNKVSGEICGMI